MSNGDARLDRHTLRTIKKGRLQKCSRPRLPAYITARVDKELLVRNEDLVIVSIISSLAVME